MRKRILISRALLGVLLSVIALYFEKASGMRYLYLALLLIGTLSVSLAGHLKGSKWLYVIECLFVFGLNYLTRFNLNLVFVSFYIMIIIYAFQSIKREDGLKIGYLSMGLLGLNFYMILPYGYNYEVIAEMVFLEIMMALIITSVYYSKLYQEEKEKVVKLLMENDQRSKMLKEAFDKAKEQNEALEASQTEVIRLSRVAERAEVASALHDTLGHELTGLIMQNEMLNMQYKDPLAKEAADHAREILRLTRQTVETLQSSTSDTFTMTKLKQKVDDFSKQSGIKINFEFEVNLDLFKEQYRQMVYRTVLEALTNTAKHSNASEIWLVLTKLKSNEYLLKIIDNGRLKDKNQSESAFKEGNGLKFIRTRVESLGGSAFFAYDVETGFEVSVKFDGGLYD